MGQSEERRGTGELEHSQHTRDMTDVTADEEQLRIVKSTVTSAKKELLSVCRQEGVKGELMWRKFLVEIE